MKPSFPLSIVIISFNTKELLGQCIDSLMKQIDLEFDEIHVVDNNSTDGSIELIEKKYPLVHLHKNHENHGFSYACNVGIRASKNDFILLSNSDIFFPLLTINQMKQKMAEDSKIGILSPELVGKDGHLDQMTWGWDISLLGELKQRFFSPNKVSQSKIVNRMVDFLQRKERDVQIVAGACMLARKEALEKINGLDERYELYFEDADVCLRLRKKGYRIRFTPDIKVVHGLGQSGKSNPRKISLIYRQSQITYYKKHHALIQLYLLKLYLFLKFFFQFQTWRDPVYRNWIIHILKETKRITLVDNLPEL